MTDWPDTLYPVSQTLYIRPVTITFASASGLSGQFKAAERPGARWVGTFDFKLAGRKAGQLEGLIAALRGPAGAVAVPDFRRTKVRPVTDSMDDYAADAGLSFFDDEYDFDDVSQDGGFLCIEESVPLGLEENILFCGNFDALLVSDDECVSLLTEDGNDIYGENVPIPFLAENGDALTLEEGEAMEIGLEEGFGLECENGDDLKFQVGGRFFEGAGTPVLAGAAWDRLSFDGLPPWANAVLIAGESIQTSPGRMHLILFDAPADLNGYGQASIQPHIRAATARLPLQTGGVKVLMRLIDDDAGANLTSPPAISTYRLQFEEILP